jgi:hypothetical protein
MGTAVTANSTMPAPDWAGKREQGAVSEARDEGLGMVLRHRGP